MPDLPTPLAAVSRRLLGVFAVACLLSGALFYASFFSNFQSTLSDWSAFGFNWPVQMFHNYLHGRPYQSSLYATSTGGTSVGFSATPYPFIHADVIHVNFTPYLFAYLWALFPEPVWLYGLIVLWTLGAGGVLTWILLRRLAPGEEASRATFLLSVLLGGGLLMILDQMGQFLLFGAPFYWAAYLAFIARRRGWFIVLIAAMCLLSEDSAMVAAAFAAYLWLFEEKGRGYGLAAAAVAIPYLALVLFVVQPAARAELTRTASNTTAVVLAHVLGLGPRGLAENLWSMMPLFTLAPAFLLCGLLFGWPGRAEARRVVALALLPALPHWGESLVVGGAHHLLPPFAFSYLALLRTAAFGRTGALRTPRWAAPAAAALFLLVALRVNAGNLPNALKPAAYRLAGKTEKAARLERALATEAASNRALIAAARALPTEASLVYLANNRAAGFVAARTRLWSFPDWLDIADYVLVQKDAQDAMFVFDPPAPGEDWRQAVRRGRAPAGRDGRVTPEMSESFRAALVREERTHRIVQDDAHVLLLERLSKVPPVDPPTTWGWGWTRNLGR